MNAKGTGTCFFQPSGYGRRCCVLYTSLSPICQPQLDPADPTTLVGAAKHLVLGILLDVSPKQSCHIPRNGTFGMSSKAESQTSELGQRYVTDRALGQPPAETLDHACDMELGLLQVQVGLSLDTDTYPAIRLWPSRTLLNNIHIPEGWSPRGSTARDLSTCGLLLVDLIRVVDTNNKSGNLGKHWDISYLDEVSRLGHGASPK